MRSKLGLIAFACLLFSLPILSADATCRMLSCSRTWGGLQDDCLCIQIGITDQNGEPQTCRIRVREIMIHPWPDTGGLPYFVCWCEFANPCTSGPI